MDLYTTERWMLERHGETVAAAERSARLGLERGELRLRLRPLVAGRLRWLADMLDDRAALNASEA